MYPNTVGVQIPDNPPVVLRQPLFMAMLKSVPVHTAGVTNLADKTGPFDTQYITTNNENDSQSDYDD